MTVNRILLQRASRHLLQNYAASWRNYSVALNSVFEKVIAAYADGGTVVLIAGYVTFSGSETFAARRLSFDVGNRGFPTL
ncbi:hypothetical protein RDI58_000760 [Solanum bulbocastanum]|uniref:Uncharacterized protein n=1 Tax=Solanum bulbocastanum TaxID=147425 RepID=A0AAN8UBI5_SOLBU